MLPNRALLSAARSPPSKFQIIHGVLPRNLNAQHLQWRRWTSTIDGVRGQRLLLTLNPQRHSSTGQEVFDISDESEVLLYCKGPSGQQEPIRLLCNGHMGGRFPPNTVGLFYGDGKTKHNFRSIRFRLCSSADNFHQGCDLHQSNGRVWSLHRTKLARSPRRLGPLLHLIQSEYPEDDSRLSRRYPILSLSPQHIVNNVGLVFDISNKTRLYPEFKTGAMQIQYNRFGIPGRTSQPPFPANTKGMFYYKQSAIAPTVIGELRFRLCDDISSFDVGKDLCLPSGLPWYLPSDSILTFPTHNALLVQLFEEGLLRPAAMSFVDKHGTAILHGLRQPFALNIGETITTICFNTGKEEVKHQMRCLFTNGRDSGPLYTGRAVVQFEKYPLEDIGSHAKHKPLFALRFLEFLTPVTKIAHQDSAMVQHLEPGQYLKRRTRAGVYQTWGYTPYRAKTQAALSEWAKRSLVPEEGP